MKLAFDTGGTFTDFVRWPATTGRSCCTEGVRVRRMTSHERCCRGSTNCWCVCAPAMARRSAPQIFQCATTVVTNAVLERRGVETAFITTDGFQDMLRIRTEGRYDLYDLKIQYPEPLVPRNLCFGAHERITADGEIITPLDEDKIRAIAAHLREAGIRSVAVCLLHAYKGVTRNTSSALASCLQALRVIFPSRCLRRSAQRCASSIARRPRSSTPTHNL